MLLTKLRDKQLICPPSWLPENTHYLTIMGSFAYGVSSDTSDMDIYGFCMPPKHMVFPHLNGDIVGFGRQIQRFEQWQEHHVKDPSEMKGHGREYDLQVFSVVKYFQLCLENNPNMIDSLFTPINCVLHATLVANMIRERRKIFLHKGCWHKFKGYAFAQVHKMKTKDPEGKRKEIRDKYGYDVKFAYHVVRLINEVEQILTTGDLDLQRDNEQLKAIRRGEWSEQQIVDWFTRREAELNKVYDESKLPHGPDEPAIKKLLLECLEAHYGSLDKCVVQTDRATQALREISAVIERERSYIFDTPKEEISNVTGDAGS